MNPSRRQRIDELFQTTVSLPPPERAAFLAQACGADDELRREVEALLAAKSGAVGHCEPTLSLGVPTKATPVPITTVPTNAGEETVADADSVPAAVEAAVENEESRAGRWLLRLTVAAVVVLVVLQVLMTVMLIKYVSTNRFGYRAERGVRGVFVLEIDPAGPAYGRLQLGDYVLAINGERRFAQTYDYVVLRRIEPGQPAQILVRRGDGEHLIEIPSAAYATFDPRIVRYLVNCTPRGLVFLTVALLIAWLKRGDSFARLAVAGFLSLAVLNLRQMMFAAANRLSGWESWVELSIMLLYGGLIFIPLSFHVALRFPPEAAVPVTRFWAGLRNLLYAVSGLLTIPAWLTALSFQSATAADILFANQYLFDQLYFEARSWYFPLGTASIGLVMARNYLAVGTADQRRRMKLVVSGMLAAIIPVVVVGLGTNFLRSRGLFDATWEVRYQFVHWFVDAATLLMPLAWAYAILTRRVYDVRVVARRGLQYLLAKNALRALLLLPLLGLVYGVISRPDQTIRELVLTQPLSIVLIALAALSLRYQGRLLTWLDRRFFRAQSDREQLLYRLIDRIGEIEDAAELCRRVSEELTAAFHPTQIRFFSRSPNGRGLRQVFVSPADAGGASFAEDAELHRLLRHRREPLVYPPPRPLDLPQAESALLDQWRIALLLPLRDSQEESVGLLLLGEKQSEEPYSPTDRQLLAAIARQTATVFEMAGLRARVERSESTERRVLARLAADEVNLLRECPQCGRCFDITDEHCAQCACRLTLTLPIERVVAGKYRLEQLIGKGGMGAVYRATDLSLRRAVAVKVIKADWFGNAAVLRRFQREARIVALLDHPGIVKVFDYGRTEAGGAWLVMELVGGVTMREELQRRGPLSPVVAAEWFGQLLAALAAAHRAGVIHRDLKPENVLIARDEQGREHVRILDFGLATQRQPNDVSDDSHHLTEPGMLVGTPCYMSPEQLAGQAAVEQSDVFAVGVMVVEALTGRRPFAGNSPVELLHAICDQDFRPVTGGEVSAKLNAVLRRCLAGEAAARYADITELRAELCAALASLGDVLLPAAPMNQDATTVLTQAMHDQITHISTGTATTELCAADTLPDAAAGREK